MCVQVTLLHKLLKDTPETEDIEVHTIDRFQVLPSDSWHMFGLNPMICTWYGYNFKALT